MKAAMADLTHVGDYGLPGSAWEIAAE